MNKQDRAKIEARIQVAAETYIAAWIQWVAVPNTESDREAKRTLDQASGAYDALVDLAVDFNLEWEAAHEAVLAAMREHSVPVPAGFEHVWQPKSEAAPVVEVQQSEPEAAPMPIEDAEPVIEELAATWKHTGMGLLMERAKRLSGYKGRLWLFDGKLRRGRGNEWYLDANGTSYYFQNKSRAARFFAEFVVRGTVNTANLRMR